MNSSFSFTTLLLYYLLWYCWTNNNVTHTLFYYTCLFCAYLFKSISKYFTVIVPNACYCCNFRLTDICGIEPATKPTLKNCHIYFLISKLQKCNHGNYLKEGDFQAVCIDFFKYLLTIVHYLFLRYHFVVYCNTLSESAYMR